MKICPCAYFEEQGHDKTGKGRPPCPKDFASYCGRGLEDRKVCQRDIHPLTKATLDHLLAFLGGLLHLPALAEVLYYDQVLS